MNLFSARNKVLHIITGLNDGGAEGVLARLCLHSSTIEHSVISFMDEGKYGPILTAAGIRVHCLGMNPNKPNPFLIFKLIRMIRIEAPNVVQTWMYHADLLGGIAARLAGVKRVFWGIRHSTLDEGKAKKSTIFIAKICAKISSWLPEKIICCAHKAQQVHAALGYQTDKLVVIGNGYDLTRFKPDQQARNTIRNELGIDGGSFILGKVGRYDPFKDHANLLQALALARQQQINLTCLLIGKGLSSENDELTAQIKTLNLQDCVHLIGPRNDIPAIMNSLDLHILSSSSEGFPNVIAEAMACGTPCISTDVGDAIEILGNKESSCPAENSPALAQLIVKKYYEWSKHPERWQQNKITAQEYIQANFSIDKMISSYLTIWGFQQHK